MHPHAAQHQAEPRRRVPQLAPCLDPGQRPIATLGGLATGEGAVIRFVISVFRSAVRPAPREVTIQGWCCQANNTNETSSSSPPAARAEAAQTRGTATPTARAARGAEAASATPVEISATTGPRAAQPGDQGLGRPQVREPDDDPDRDEQREATGPPDLCGRGHRSQQVCCPVPQPDHDRGRHRRRRDAEQADRPASGVCSQRRHDPRGRRPPQPSAATGVARAVGTSQAVMTCARVWRAGCSRPRASARRAGRRTAGRRGGGRGRSR